MRELSSNEVEDVGGAWTIGQAFSYGTRVTMGTLGVAQLGWQSWSDLTRGASFPSFQYIRSNSWNG